MKIHDVEQQSREWMQLHVGIPTAGGLDNLLTPEFELRKGETPKTYVYRKVAEAWRGKPLIDLGGSSFAMEQGMILESEAIPFWELTTGRKITRVGFITTDDGRFGCSPDGLIYDAFSGDNTPKKKDRGRADSQDERLMPPDPRACGIEIKCPAPNTHVKYLSEGVIPKEYRAQVYGSMFATGFTKWVFMSYCRGFPPLILEVNHDPEIGNKIALAIISFHEQFKRGRAILERYQANPLNEFK
jgi:hypothetical protein